EIPENSPVGTPVVRVQASDPDEGENGKVQYRLASWSSSSSSSQPLDSSSGLVVVWGLLDREEADVHRLVIVATDCAPSRPASATATLTIVVGDENDTPPEIELRIIARTEGDAVTADDTDDDGFPIALISVSDRDSGSGGVVSLSISLDGDEESAGKDEEDEAGAAADLPFRVRRLPPSPDRYLLETGVGLDRERRERHVVRVVAKDSGVPRLSSTAVVFVRVADANDNPPTFPRRVYEAAVAENGPPGLRVASVMATDADVGKNGAVVYSIERPSSSAFRIELTTGLVTASQSLDREDAPGGYALAVVASDRGVPPLSATATVIVRILDRNDNAPQFELPDFHFYVRENQPAGNIIGRVSAWDPDEGDNGKLEYAITVVNALFSIDPDTGVIRAGFSFDREKQHFYTLEVRARDLDQTPTSRLSSSARVFIHVVDEDDNAPEFLAPKTNSTAVVAAADETKSASSSSATSTAKSPMAPMQYSIDGGNPRGLFAIDARTGLVTVREALTDEHAGLHRLVLCARDTRHRAIALLHVFANATLDDVTAVNRLITRSLATPLSKNVSG
uniref:Cadherin domain-containing protein n=1 Tax=Petromyzon marinus TaxID=7757 RepID=S4RLU7_PETMA